MQKSLNQAVARLFGATFHTSPGGDGPLLGANSPYSECVAPDFYETNAYLARMERLSHNISRQRQHFMWMNPVQSAVIR